MVRYMTNIIWTKTGPIVFRVETVIVSHVEL